MKQRLRQLLARLYRKLTPKPDPVPALQDENRTLRNLLDKLSNQNAEREVRQRYVRLVGELAEAKQMAGAGPWTVSPATLEATEAFISTAVQEIKARETIGDAAIGASGDINLMLANIAWKREINLSWLEFSRWGIQQIMLITRLYYIKNPIIRRLIDVCAAYVFARGVEVVSSDEKANEVLQEFFEDNKTVLGQNALIESEKAKDYDGNLFWAFFTSKADGKTKIRRIDATEIQEIITDPDDSDTPWYYHRVWGQRSFDPTTGSSITNMERWYPAINFDPAVKPDSIAKIPIEWDVPLYHRKCGTVGKWLFGCPRMFPAIDWARSAKEFLTSVLSLFQTLMEIGLTITTKGGQQAIEGAKAQLSTAVGPNTNIWDVNPTPVPGAIFASGTGTEVKAMDLTGAGVDPEKVRQYKLMCAMTAGVPETFLADVSTGNLATATSLDRPTETIFLEKQEAWREDLITISTYVLERAKGAAGGKLSESHAFGRGVKVRECGRHIGPRGEVIYEAFAKQEDEIEIRVNFPAIREGDLPSLIKATVEAMTLDNKGGQIIGIDAKAGVLKLFDLLGIEDGVEITEQMFPEGEYDPDRTKAPLPAPIQKGELPPGGQPQIDPQTGEPTNPPTVAQEAMPVYRRGNGGRPV
jgi:hypothetical protein